MRIRLLPGTAILLATTGLAYASGLDGVFQFDDFNVIVDNPAVHGLAPWYRDLGGIRPLLKFTYALNWMAGPEPLGFHALNLAIHAANVGLAFALLRRFGQADGSPDATGMSGRERVALFAALVFALHPAQTEAVTYICGRSTSLMALLYLASLVAYLRGREDASRAWSRAFSPLAFLLACLVKETAVTLPFALLLWEGCAGRWPGWRSFLRATAFHWAILALAGFGLLLHPGHRALLDYSAALRPLPQNLLDQIPAVSYLLRVWAWPTDLNIDPALQGATGWSGRILLQASGLAALLAVALANLKRRPWLACGLLWAALHVLPEHSLIPRLDRVSERHLYLPSLGLAFVLAEGAGRLATRWRLPAPLGLSLAAAVALALGTRTAFRNRDYRSEVALWSSSVAANPANPRAHNNLGYAYRLAGEPAKARKAYARALALDPGYAKARVNLEALDGP